MADNIQLQTTEGGKGGMERLYTSRPLEFGFKSISGVSSMLTTLLIIIKAFGLVAFPLDLIISLSALVFVLSGLGLYFFSLKPKYKNLQSALENSKIEYSTLQAEHEKQHGKLLGSNQAIEHISEERDKYNRTLNRYWCIIEEARLQEKFIEKYVTLEHVFFCHIPKGKPEKIIFALEVRNDSLFEVEIVEDELSRFISFDTLVLHGDKFLYENSKIPPRHTYTITFEQRLKDGDLGYINDWVEEDIHKGIDIASWFRFDTLKFNIKCTDEKKEVDTKPLTIRPGLHAVNRDKYDRAKEDFG